MMSQNYAPTTPDHDDEQQSVAALAGVPLVSKLDPKNPKMCFGGGGRFRFQKGLLKLKRR